MGALWAGVAVAAGSAIMGAKQNADAADENERRAGESKKDYANRLKAAAEVAKKMSKEYDEIVENRPGLSWESFVRDKMRSLNDPFLRDAYTNAKKQDFENMRAFADAATSDNVENLQEVADRLSGGRWKDIIDQRDKLVLETDAAERYARTYELAAPVRTGASTVKYDNKGNLIEGQRSDKQAFQIANEVQTDVEREQKSDLRQLETDRLSAAESQVEKARSYLGFFDATGYATAAEADRSNLVHGRQQTDEERQFELFKLFAGAAAGITATQPSYVNPGVGNELISSGMQLASSSISAYNNKPKGQGSGGTYS